MKQKKMKLEIKGELLKKVINSAKHHGFGSSELAMYCRILLAKQLKLKWREATKK